MEAQILDKVLEEMVAFQHLVRSHQQAEVLEVVVDKFQVQVNQALPFLKRRVVQEDLVVDQAHQIKVELRHQEEQETHLQ